MIEVENLTVRYGDKTVLDGVSFTLKDGEWLMVVGPNGAGKSTLIGAISQSVAYTGRVRIDGKDAAKLRPAVLARKLGVLSQNHAVGYSFTVEEVVHLGRYSYGSGLFSGGPEDGAAVEAALERTGLTELRDHSVLTLSGGELQRVFLAQMIAQDPAAMLLDEPTNHLDLVFQRQIFSLVQQWVAEEGRAVLSVVHDLSLARAYGSKALLLDRGRQVAWGPTAEVLDREHLRQVYRMDVVDHMQALLRQWEKA